MDTTPYVQRSLFQLPYLSEEELRAIIKPFHPFLWPVVMVPWEDLVDRRGRDKSFTDMTEEEMAIWLTMQAGKMAVAIFDGKPGIEVRKWFRKPVVIIPDVLAIVIKKLTKRRLRRCGEKELARSNFLTNRNKSLWNQEPIAGLPDIPRVILGYEFAKEATELRLYIAYPRTRGHGVDWAYRLRQPKDANAPFPTIVPIHGEQKPFTIGPAEVDDRKKVGGKR